METSTPQPLAPADLRGLKFFGPLEKLLERLHAQRCHPNREFHCDQYVLLLLLAYFNPALYSIRALQLAAGLPRVRAAFDVSRPSLGSFSEAGRVFDPEPLRDIFRELARQLHPADAPPRPAGLPDDLAVLAVDGTLWSLLPRMAPLFWAAGPRSGRPPGFKAHLQFAVFRGLPEDARLTDGYASERRALEETLQALTLYLIDAGYLDYVFLQTIMDHRSHFITRARSDTVCHTLEERPLTPAARAAGVYSDALVRVGSAPHAGKLRQPLRLIKARVTLPAPHNLAPSTRSGRRDPQHRYDPQVMELELLTSLLDLDADLILQLYRYRWHVEIFFRWFKCVLGCAHFFSESENGMALQLYAALIATLLVTLYTQRKPCKMLLVIMHCYLIGWATWDDVERVVTKLKPARV